MLEELKYFYLEVMFSIKEESYRYYYKIIAASWEEAMCQYHTYSKNSSLKTLGVWPEYINACFEIGTEESPHNLFKKYTFHRQFYHPKTWRGRFSWLFKWSRRNKMFQKWNQKSSAS